MSRGQSSNLGIHVSIDTSTKMSSNINFKKTNYFKEVDKMTKHFALKLNCSLKSIGLIIIALSFVLGFGRGVSPFA